MESKKQVFRLSPRPHAESFKDIQVLGSNRILNKKDQINHEFNFHALTLVTKGGGYFIDEDNQRHEMVAGHLIHIVPGHHYRFGPKEEGLTWDEYYLCLWGRGLRRWQTRGWLAKKPRLDWIPKADKFIDDFMNIKKLLKTPLPGNLDRSVVNAERLVMELFHARRREPSPETKSPLIERAISAMHQQYTEEIDWEDFSKQLAVSYSLLRREIKDKTGTTPYHLLCHIRIQAAQELLKDPELSIAEVGEEVGIPDQFSFSRTFKRHIGMSPRAYQKQIKIWR